MIEMNFNFISKFNN